VFSTLVYRHAKRSGATAARGTRPLTHYRPTMPFGNRKIFLEDLFSSELSQFKKYHPPGNLKFNNLRIFQSLKLRIFMEKISLISKLSFIPNTSGCCGLTQLLSVRSKHDSEIKVGARAHIFNRAKSS